MTPWDEKGLVFHIDTKGCHVRRM